MGGLRLLRRTVVVLLLFAPRLWLRREVLLFRRLGLSRTVLRLARLGLSLKVLLFARLGLCLDVLFSLELLRIFCILPPGLLRLRVPAFWLNVLRPLLT